MCKNSPVSGWGGLSMKSNINMLKEFPKLAAIHNTQLTKSNKMDYGLDSKFQLLMTDSIGWVGVWVAKSP